MVDPPEVDPPAIAAVIAAADNKVNRMVRIWDQHSPLRCAPREQMVISVKKYHHLLPFSCYEPYRHNPPTSSAAVIQLHLDRVGRHAEARDFLHLEPHVRVDDVIGEDTATRQELAILVQLLQRHIQG